MIPRHSLPFGARDIFSILLSSGPALNSRDVEKAYADALGVRSALLLPSVRAGTHMAILAAGRPGLPVTAPAYTCFTMHEALTLSGASIRLVDSAPGSFLMQPEDISAASWAGGVVVLSEVYGLPYDPDMLRKASEKGPRMRVFDMAMSIPSPERMAQLETGDVALFSFGWGKPMYAGWGGIACFQDTALAETVLGIRDRWAIRESSGLGFRRGASLLFRAAANQRYIYGLSHESHFYRLYKNMTKDRGTEGTADASQSSSYKPALTLPPEWSRPMTGLNRALAMHNLRNSIKHARLRRLQAEIYFSCIVEPGIARGPGGSALPQSHFPLRIPSGIRNAFGDYLRGRGIDTSTLFSLPAGLGRDLYPNAAEAAEAVLTLPLGMSITTEDARKISECVKDGLQALGC